MRTLILGLAALTMAVPALTPALAGKNDQRDDYGRYYDNDNYYSGPTWRGEDGRTYCRRRDGTAGLVIGAAAGRAGRPGDRHPWQPRHRDHRRRRARRAGRPRGCPQPLPIRRARRGACRLFPRSRLCRLF